jgi:hypothetical protein
VSPVDQDRKLDTFRTTKVDKNVHGGPDSASGKQDVIDEDGFFVVYGKRDICFLDNRLMSNPGPVIPVQIDINVPFWHKGALYLGDFFLYPIGEIYPAGIDSDQSKVVYSLMGFQYLMRHPRKYPVDILVYKNSFLM